MGGEAYLGAYPGSVPLVTMAEGSAPTDTVMVKSGPYGIIGTAQDASVLVTSTANVVSIGTVLVPVRASARYQRHTYVMSTSSTWAWKLLMVWHRGEGVRWGAAAW